MGVCIETSVGCPAPTPLRPSHPIWVCVLKQQQRLMYAYEQMVTPYMGVCIETVASGLPSQIIFGHTLYGCVY